MIFNFLTMKTTNFTEVSVKYFHQNFLITLLIARSSIAAFQDLLTHSETPKDGRKSTPTMAENKTYFPPNRPVLKTSGTKHFQGKSGRTLTHPLTSTSHVIPTHENASPNIQHGYLHSRDYKY